MTSSAGKRILVAPLDWGLGHSSRCLPLIAYLQSLGHKVVVAGNDWQRRYIKENLPAIDTLHLDGYEMKYSRKGSGFMFAMFRQMPKLLAAVRKENDWLLEQVAGQGFDAVISDNRYGLFHKKIPCAIMTHQLAVRTGLGKVADDMLRKLHYKYLERFGKCWVVDTAANKGLGGKLSHPKAVPANAEYIGLLSQFGAGNHREGKHLLVLLSGPEPQRSILSAKLWEQVKSYPGPVVFVEGSHKAKSPAAVPAHVQWHARVGTGQLQPLMQNASLVICRSGYSSLMDLVAMNRKAIVIPTPGQTEQLYLARHLHKEGVFFACAQNGFQLKKELEEIKLFPFKDAALTAAFTEYRPVLDKWLENI